MLQSRREGIRAETLSVGIAALTLLFKVRNRHLSESPVLNGRSQIVPNEKGRKKKPEQKPRNCDLEKESKKGLVSFRAKVFNKL